MNTTVVSNYFGGGGDSAGLAALAVGLILVAVLSGTLVLAAVIDKSPMYLTGLVIPLLLMSFGVEASHESFRRADDSKNQVISQLEHEGITDFNRDTQTAFYARKNGVLVHCVALSESRDKWDILCK